MIFSSDWAKSEASTSLRSETRRQQRSLVDEVREVRADHAGRRRCNAGEVDVRRERHVSRVHLEDETAAFTVRRHDHYATVEAARPE